MAEVPATITHGAYVATLTANNDERARWDIHRGDKLVGAMYEGPAYGWGRPRCCMTPLVWSGRFPPGHADSRSPNYGMLFDTGPQSSHDEALAKFAKRADRLIQWRLDNPKPENTDGSTVLS